MKVTVFTDYACPFCYIGHRTLKKILEESVEDIEVEYIFMEIHPEVPEAGIDTGKIVSGPLENFNAHIKRTAADCGIEPRLGNRISNSRKAIILRAFVGYCYPDRLEEFDDKVYAAYLIENQDIGDETVLADIFKRMGFGETVKDALNHTMANIKFEMDRSKSMSNYVYEIPAYVAEDGSGRRICGAVTSEQLKAFLGIL